jgi:hypothetical protein
MWNVESAWNGQSLIPLPQISVPTIENKHAGATVTLTVTLLNSESVGSVTYAWVQTEGDNVAVMGQGTNQIVFVAPSKDAAQNVVFDITVTNSNGDEVTKSITVPVLSVVEGITEIRPYTFVKGNLLASDSRANVMLYQHSDNYIYCEVFSTQGVVINPDNFPKLEYIIADMEGEAVITLTHENGIRKHMDGFLIHIDDKMLTDDIIGKYKHQLVVFNISDDKLPPVFTGKATVKAVIH